MKETIILLYFLQADYGRRLLRFLTRKKNKQIRLELMTERTSDVADGDREPADCCFDR